jgi:hypothetical protein
LNAPAGGIDEGDADPAWRDADWDWLMAGRAGAILGRGFTKFAPVSMSDKS